MMDSTLGFNSVTVVCTKSTVGRTFVLISSAKAPTLEEVFRIARYIATRIDACRSTENEVIAKKTREEQAEFDQRKKEAVDLGMTPGTTEYVEYVGTGKVTNVPRRSTGQATVHFTSSPSGGEIYVDGKFVGNTPSDITIAAGEHIVKVTTSGKEWSRSIQITSGEISLHAEIQADR